MKSHTAIGCRRTDTNANYTAGRVSEVLPDRGLSFKGSTSPAVQVARSRTNLLTGMSELGSDLLTKGRPAKNSFSSKLLSKAELLLDVRRNACT